MVSVGATSLVNDLHRLSPSPSLAPTTATSPRSSVIYSKQDLEHIGHFDTLSVSTNSSSVKAMTSLVTQTESKELEEDFRLLAISAQMTEISYCISDIQTRIFEIQELRHQAVVAPDRQVTGSPRDASISAIDQALISLDEKLESVSKSIDNLEQSIDNASPISSTPTQFASTDNDISIVLRKRQVLMEEWDSVQRESEELRRELADDKWLVVFRTVTEQADNMMASLEKILTQCQDFMWQVQKAQHSEQRPHSYDTTLESPRRDCEHHVALSNNLEAKKTYYVPSITKILSILDKGLRDHTKNGECLRRHTESRARWRNLRERIGRVESQMEGTRRLLSEQTNELQASSGTTEVTESSSISVDNSASAQVAPSSAPARTRPPSSLSLSRSMSPFRKLALRVSNSVTQGRATPTPNRSTTSSEPPLANVRTRTSLFFRKSQPETPPDRIRHAYSASVASPDSIDNESPSRYSSDTPTKPRPKWNSSTKIEPSRGELKVVALKAKSRRPSASALSLFSPGVDAPPVPPLPQRSASRSSMGSSRPWSPVASTSTMSTVSSTKLPISRPVSRSTDYYPLSNPRSRPKTPSQIPTPSSKARSVSSPHYFGGRETPETTLMQRAFSPSTSISERSAAAYTERSKTPSRIPTPRTPSRAHLSVPGVDDSRHNSPLSRTGVQTPEATIRARALQVPVYRGVQTPRPSLSRGPPSSFKGDARLTPLDRKFTPSTEPLITSQYTPNLKDPLDVEVSKTVNGIAHGFLFERIDPPLRNTPTRAQDLTAQYAVSNALGRKILNCRLVVIKRSTSTSDLSGDGTTKKVMCRVGGGWLDLHMYLLNHQAGV